MSQVHSQPGNPASGLAPEPSWLRRRARALLVGGSLTLAVGLVSTLCMYLRVSNFGEESIYQVGDVPARRVAIVFGAKVYSDGSVSGHLEQRLEAARELHRRGKVKKILVSGDNRWNHYNEPERMREWLIANGVPEEDVGCDYAGRRTLDTCGRASRLWALKQPILVTQRYHLPRALYLAEAYRMSAVGVASDGAGLGYGRRLALREALARVLAWLDVNLLQTEPYHWGAKEEI